MVEQKDMSNFIIKCLYNDEKGDAELFEVLAKDRLMYDHMAKKWRIYKCGVWKLDQLKEARKFAQKVLPNMYFEFAKEQDNLISELSLKGDSNVKIKELEKRRDFARRRGRNLNTKKRIENVLELSTSYLPCKITEFDQDLELFNLCNGTFSLRDFTFKEHDPSDRLSISSMASYNSTASCEVWKLFLDKLFLGNAELIKYVQKFIGYCLTGKTDLQLMNFCFGSGKNGKSTFFAVLRILFGDYYKAIPAEVIMTKQNNDNVSLGYLAGLIGARIVVTSEIPKGKSFNEALIKNITGQDLINAKNLFQDPFSFEPTHKLWTYGNHKPIIKGQDEGIWRRINLIPFNYRVPQEERVEMSELIAKFQEELSGIFNWAVEGYRLYKDEGLNMPEIIINSNSEYRSDSDSLTEFFDSVCDLTDHLGFVYSKDLNIKYEKFCADNNEKSEFGTSKALLNALKERGFVTEKGTGNKTRILGIKLKE